MSQMPQQGDHSPQECCSRQDGDILSEPLADLSGAEGTLTAPPRDDTSAEAAGPVAPHAESGKEDVGREGAASGAEAEGAGTGLSTSEKSPDGGHQPGQGALRGRIEDVLETCATPWS